jgi:GxxExxY protein
MKATEYTEGTDNYRGYPESELTGKIIELAIEVHRTLGPGFLEAIYENALVIELEKVGLKCEQQKQVDVFYKGIKVGEHRLDLLVDSKVIVEVKAVKSLEDIHRSQIISYLTATGIRIGLLLNFGKTKLEIDRVIV